jgi:hypothetical protein
MNNDTLCMIIILECLATRRGKTTSRELANHVQQHGLPGHIRGIQRYIHALQDHYWIDEVPGDSGREGSGYQLAQPLDRRFIHAMQYLIETWVEGELLCA